LRLLLDTNAFLWWVVDSPRLSKSARDAISGEDVLVSSATGFEIATKRKSGKLRFDDDIVLQVTRNGFRPLDVTIEHAVAAGELPLHHRDPFDRILIAQAQLEQLIVVTSDPMFDRYEVPVLSAN
jgi:PIN domain nuclease of toxin-antitoxin system